MHSLYAVYYIHRLLPLTTTPSSSQYHYGYGVHPGSIDWMLLAWQVNMIDWRDNYNWFASRRIITVCRRWRTQGVFSEVGTLLTHRANQPAPDRVSSSSAYQHPINHQLPDGWLAGLNDPIHCLAAFISALQKSLNNHIGAILRFHQSNLSFAKNIIGFCFVYLTTFFFFFLLLL